MIYYLVTEKHAYTWQRFLASWGRAFAGRISILTYEWIQSGKRNWDRNGRYIFTDMDRLPLKTRASLAGLHTALCDACGSARVLNDPLRSLLRFDLLRTLHAAGLNDFAVYRVSQRDVPPRFPVILRTEHGHVNKPLPMLADAAAYRAALEQLGKARAKLSELIAVEFCNVGDRDGVNRKYGAFVIGERILPRHLFFDSNWMVKEAKLATPSLLEEERAYLDANPHEDALRRIARVACISYGRLDYGIANGRVQTWEINTNPMLASAISSEIPARRDSHLKFVALLEQAIDEFDPPPGASPHG